MDVEAVYGAEYTALQNIKTQIWNLYKSDVFFKILVIYAPSNNINIIISKNKSNQTTILWWHILDIL